MSGFRRISYRLICRYFVELRSVARGQICLLWYPFWYPIGGQVATGSRQTGHLRSGEKWRWEPLVLARHLRPSRRPLLWLTGATKLTEETSPA